MIGPPGNPEIATRFLETPWNFDPNFGLQVVIDFPSQKYLATHPLLWRGFWKPNDFLACPAKSFWLPIPFCDAVSGNPMIFCYVQPKVFGYLSLFATRFLETQWFFGMFSQIFLATYPWLWRVLKNQSHFLVPSQKKSAHHPETMTHYGSTGLGSRRTLSQKDHRTSEPQKLGTTAPTSPSNIPSSNKHHEEEHDHLRSIALVSGTNGK